MLEDKKGKAKDTHHLCIEKIKSLQALCRDLARKIDSLHGDHTDFRLHVSDMIDFLKERYMKLETKIQEIDIPRQSFLQKFKNLFS